MYQLLGLVLVTRRDRVPVVSLFGEGLYTRQIPMSPSHTLPETKMKKLQQADAAGRALME